MEIKKEWTLNKNGARVLSKIILIISFSRTVTGFRYEKESKYNGKNQKSLIMNIVSGIRFNINNTGSLN